MKKLTVICLFFAVFAIHKAHAQPTFYIDPPEIVADPGDEVCVQIRFMNFTNIIGVSFSLEYDEDVLIDPVFNPVSLAGLPMFSLANLDNPEPGKLTIEWDDGQPCQTATNGPTIVDGEMLFEVCFTADTLYGGHTPICFTDTPVDQVVQRSSANCQDIGEFTECGFVSIGTKPLSVNISSGDGFQGDVVCLDFEVEDFDCIVSFQNAILWDETVLEYVSATPSNIPNFTGANIGQTQVTDGILNLSWWSSTGGVDLDDGTQFLEVCFEILGDCGANTEVSVGPNPLGGPVEVVNCTSGSTSAGTNIGILQTEGVVSVNCFDPESITVNIEDKQVCPGESFMVDITVEDFDDIVDLVFNIKWNPAVISLNNSPSNGVSYPDGEPCFLFGSGGTVDINPVQGLINVDWNSFSFGCDVSPNDVFMRLHFTAVGSSGTNTTIAIINPINVEQFGATGDNIGINNNNGLVEICELNSPTIIASSATVDAGDQVCIEFDVQDFEDIVRTQYTLSWEPTVLEYVGPQSFNLPGLGTFNFLDTQTDQGFLGVEWESVSPITVPDGTTIFELCFDVIGDPDECSEIGFGDIPWAVDVVTSESGGTNVGLNGVPGQVCVDNPLDFFVSASSVFGSPGAEVCLDITATGLNQLTEMNYSINWNTSIIEFVRVEETGNLPNFSDASYDDSPSFVDDGQLVINWETDNNPQGTTLPDGTVLFRVCFKVLGDDGECSGVSFSGNPEPIDIKTAPTGNANLGMTSQAGEVCVNATISVLDPIVVDVACPTIPSGSIDLQVEGGSGEYTFEWVGFNVNPSSEDQSGLFAGNYFVTITDAFNPALVVEMEIPVNLEANAPVANAGQDTTFNCFSQGLTLNGSASSTGPNLVYFWESIDSGFPGVVNPETDSTLAPEIFGGAFYMLTVTDTSTGCFDLDTVVVSQAVIAVPEIATDFAMLDCVTDTVLLDGGDSAFGFDILWETPDGSIVPGMEDEIMTNVLDPGMYILTFSNDDTGCARSDTVLVVEDIELPSACAGLDGVIGCQDEEAPLDGSCSSMGSDFIYEWSPMGGGEVCDDINSPTTAVCAPGMYQLLVTDITNGCTAVDEVQVTADTLKPTAIAGDDQALNCAVTMVSLDGSASSQGSEFIYTWFEMGTQVGTGQTLEVSAPGVYTLEVMDTTNDCSAISEVTVDDLSEEVLAEANSSNAITCGIGSSLLDWGNSDVGPEYMHSWQNEMGMTVGTTDSITVTEPGVYFLTVINTTNECEETIEIEVVDSTLLPTIEAGEDEMLGCVDFISLEGEADTNNPNLVFQWQGPGVGCISDGTTLTPEVECPGEYILVVVDNSTECISMDTLQVIPDNQEPGAMVNDPISDVFPCNLDEMILEGSTSATDFEVQWTSVPVVPISGENTLTATITEPAIYTLTITSNDNGCSSEVEVTINPPTLPVADAGGDMLLDCQTTEAILSAANSTLDGTTLIWENLNGDPITNPNEVEIIVGEGSYQLTVIDDLGCSSTDQATITIDGELPDVDAGNDTVKECDEEFALLIGVAEPGQLYTWTNEDGMIVGTSLTLQATDPGVYTLTVEDANSGCQNQDSAMVSLADAGEPADASFDYDPCAPDAMLLGNLPEGTTGIWTPLSGGTVEEPNEPVTVGTGFSQGENQFVWTLTLGTCFEYSSDTVTVMVDESVPDALDDFTVMDAQSQGVSIFNVLENDIYDASVTDFGLLDNNGLIGTADLSEDGTLTFNKEKCFTGTVEIDYELCNSTCPDLCDQATLTIDVLLDETENCDDIPNAITPNGDGLNDELVFDILLANPDFEDNEIIIFNRWGDIVYQAKPYLNDWRGTNDSGKDLPHGTYYYILKLDIADGDIIRGDVTILK